MCRVPDVYCEWVGLATCPGKTSSLLAEPSHSSLDVFYYFWGNRLNSFWWRSTKHPEGTWPCKNLSLLAESNHRPLDYESSALTNWAKRAYSHLCKYRITSTCIIRITCNLKLGCQQAGRAKPPSRLACLAGRSWSYSVVGYHRGFWFLWPEFESRWDLSFFKIEFPKVSQLYGIEIIDKWRNCVVERQWARGAKSTLAGLEPTRNNSNWFLVNRLNHSAKVSHFDCHNSAKDQNRSLIVTSLMFTDGSGYLINRPVCAGIWYPRCRSEAWYMHIVLWGLFR